MKPVAPALLALLLSACAAGPGGERRAPPPAASAPVLSSTEVADPEPAAPAPELGSRGQPLAAGLPATLKSETAMRAQPLLKAPVLRSVPGGTAVRVLGGVLDNIDGRWLSVLLDDIVGWLPAEALDYTH